MDAVELDDIGLINGANTFGTDILNGSQPIVYTQDIPTALNSDDLSVYDNRLAYVSIPIRIVQDSQNIISGYLFENSQLPLVNRQVIVTQGFTEPSSQNDTNQDIITKQMINFVPTTVGSLVDNINQDFVNEGCDISGVNGLSQTVPEETIDSVVNSDVKPPDKSGPFICEICVVKFNSWKLYKRHKLSHLNDKPYKCNECSESFNIELNHKLHVATHNTHNPFCPECNKKFSRIASLKAHILLHIEEESLSCLECGDEFSNQRYLEEHMMEHKGIMPAKKKKIFKCLQCDNKFPTSAKLKDHVKDHHKGKVMKRPKKRRRGAHVCEFCSKCFEKPSQLCRHKRIHTGEKPFKCELCPRAFNQKGSLQIHMLKHNGLRPYECKLCNATFSQKCNLQAHVQRLHFVSSNDRVHKCDQCSCVFRKLGSLNAHNTRVHGIPTQDSKLIQSKDGTSSNPSGKDSSDKENDGQRLVNVSQRYVTITNLLEDGSVLKQTVSQRCVGNVKWHQCTYCSDEFKRPSDLVRHIRIHTHERPFKCKICFRSFAVRSTLTGHMRTHTGIKDYQCQICNKGFATSSSLKFHQKIHLKQKTFPCKKCELVFSSMNDKKTHMIAKHGAKPQTEHVEARKQDNTVILEAIGMNTNKNNEMINTTNTEESQEDSTRPFKCQQCPSSYKRSSYLKVHVRSHAKEKRFVCNVCNNSFVSNSLLKTHMATHTGNKEHTCEECGKGLSCLASLKRHIETHVPGHAYACPLCSRPYKSHAACSKHILSHANTGEEKLKPVPLMKQQKENSSISVDENAILSIVNEPTESSGVQNGTKCDNTALQGDLGELIRSLQPGQQFTLTSNGMGGLSVSTQPMSSVPTPSLTNSASTNMNEEQFGEFDERINQQLFSSLSEDPKNSLFDQEGLDGCVFLQNDHLEMGGTVIGANLATILPPQLHICDLCEMAFHSSTDLTIHKINHLQEKSIDRTCIACNTLFTTIEELQVHLKNGSCQLKEHESNEISLASLLPNTTILHRCSKCGLDFNTSEDLNVHSVIHSHENGNPVQKGEICQHCQKVFSSTLELQEHLKLHENNENAMECTTRNDPSPLEGDVTNNMLVHGASKIKVEIVNADRRAKLNTNVRKKTKKRKSNFHRLTEEETRAVTLMELNPASISEKFLLQSILEKDKTAEEKESGSKAKVEVHANKCRYCPKSFRKASDLIRHLRIHTGEKPYQCSRCNKCFTHKSTAACHMKTHMNIKSFKCHICSKLFSTTGSLKLHMRLHTGSKPFSCPLCDAKFRTSGHKKAHLMKHVKQATQQSLLKAKVSQKNILEEAGSQVGLETALAESIGNILAEKGEMVSLEPSLIQGQTLELDQRVFASSQIGEFLNSKAQSNNTHFILQAIEGSPTEGSEGPAPTRFLVTFSDQPPTNPNHPLEPFVEILTEHVKNAQLMASQPYEGGGSSTQALDLEASIQEISNKNEQILNKGSNELNTCMICSQPFMSYTSLCRHINKVHSLTNDEEESRSKVTCTVCNKTFAKQASLDKHMKKHQEEESECIVCSQKFPRKQDLEVHMLDHALGPSWSCPNCDENFNSEDLFKAHKCSVEDKASLKTNSATPTFDLFNELFLFPPC